MNTQFVKFLVLIFLLLSLLILVYVFYRSEIVYKGSNFHYYFKYYLFSIGAVVFWTMVLFFKNEVKKNLLLFSFSFIFSLYFLEFLLNFVFYTNVYTVHRKIFNQNFDTRTNMEFVEDKRGKGIDIFPILKQGLVRDKFINKKSEEILALSPGISKKVTVLCNELGNYVTYKSDRYGFNNPDTEWDNASTHVLLIGDSYIHGHCVSPKENMTSQIRAMTGKSTLNLGVGGIGPLRELAILKEYASSKKPKNLFWMYYEGNDMEDFEVELKNKILVKYLKKNFTQNLMNHQEEIDHFKNETFNNLISDRNTLLHKIRFLRLYELRTFIRRFLGSLYYKKQKTKRVVYVNPLLINVLSEAKNLTESWGGNFFFVYIPEYSRYKSKVRNHETFNKKAEIINLLENKNIVVIDLHKEVFIKKSNHKIMYICHTCHLTSYAYKKIAEFITTQVIKN